MVSKAYFSHKSNSAHGAQRVHDLRMQTFNKKVKRHHTFLRFMIYFNSKMSTPTD